MLSVCGALLVTSCKSSISATVKTSPADAPPNASKQWRLAQETVAADNQKDYVEGIDALRTLDAFGTMEVSQLFYHHKLTMVPAGTLLAEAGPGEKGATRVRVMDGPQAGKILWLYPESADKMGFPAASPPH